MINKWLKLEESPSTWKWFLYLSIIDYALSLLDSISDGTVNLGLIFSGMIVISIYGLANNKAILSIKIWKGLFWFMIIFTGIVLFSSGINLKQYSFIYIVSSIAISIYYIIQLRALFLYSYKRNNLWAK